MCGSGRHHCTISGKRPGQGVGHLRAEFRPHLVECQHMRCTCTWASQSCWGESPTKAAHRRRHRGQLKSVHWSYMKLVAGAACTGIASYQQPAMDGTASTMASLMMVRQPLLCSLLTHSFLFVSTMHAHYPFDVFLVVVAGWHIGVASLQHYFGGCVAH